MLQFDNGPGRPVRDPHVEHLQSAAGRSLHGKRHLGHSSRTMAAHDRPSRTSQQMDTADGGIERPQDRQIDRRKLHEGFGKCYSSGETGVVGGSRGDFGSCFGTGAVEADVLAG